MSHFSVAVFCGADLDPSDYGDVEARVTELMAKYDENLTLPKYKVHVDDHYDPDDFFWSLGHDETIHDIVGRPPEGPNWEEMRGRNASQEEMDAARDAYKAARHAWELAAVEKLGVERTLQSLNRYDDGEEHGHDEQGYYYWTTRNPVGNWDYWRIGGRWSGSLIVKPGTDFGRSPTVAWEFAANRNPGAIALATREMPVERARELGEDNPYQGRRVDIARIRDIDVDSINALERANRTRALAEYDAAVAAGEDPKRARFELLISYNVNEVPETPEERQAFINNVFGFYFYAYVTTDGTWIQKEEGWRKAKDGENWYPEAEYRRRFEEYFKAQDPDTVIAIADCHT